MYSNILFIGDLHESFYLDSYLQFNINLFEKYQCKEVIFIGDVIDAHAWKAFPEANVLHDPFILSPLKGIPCGTMNESDTKK
jgi:hypothetical protein